jgi:hypothetical protein
VNKNVPPSQKYSKSLTLTQTVYQEDLATFKFQLQQIVVTKQNMYDWIPTTFQTEPVIKYMLTFINGHCCPLQSLCNGSSVPTTAGSIHRSHFLEPHVGQKAIVPQYQEYSGIMPS